MSTPIELVFTVSGKAHTVTVTSRRQIAGKINDLFPSGDWDKTTRQARDFLLEKANKLWTAENGKGSSETPKARQARPSAQDLATWHVRSERKDHGLKPNDKLSSTEQQRVEELTMGIKTAAARGKERKARAAKKSMTHKRANRILNALEAMKGCKAPKQGPAIEMALTPARKLAFKELRKARADRQADINAAKYALAKQFKSLGDAVINAAVEAAADYFEAIHGKVTLGAIKKAASSRLVYKATAEERNAYFAEQEQRA